MTQILNTLFLDNPYLPEQISHFCNTLPEYRQAELEYQAAEKELIDQLGFETYNHFNQVQSHYIAQLVHAYYLFGLGLRQEVLFALET